MYVYLNSKPNLWIVGYYSPDGKWHPESDHCTAQSAMEKTAYLNGGNNPKKQNETFIVLELFNPLFINVHCNADGETIYFDNKEDAKLVADQECQAGIVVDITSYV